MKEIVYEKIKIIYNDCLLSMDNIPDKSIQMILCDLPYGTTNNEWDVMIPIDNVKPKHV